MLSTQQLLNFGDSNLDFLENNLLDQDDWRVNNNDLLDDFFDQGSGSPSTSSLDSGQGSSTISPISLHNDDIDAWLQDGLIQQQPFSNIIKEEPPSPPALNAIEVSPPIFPAEVSINNPILKTISLQNNEVNVAKKLPIPRKTATRTRPTPPLHGKIVNSIPKIPLPKSRAPVTSSMVKLNNLSNLPLKSEQLNTALLPGDKYTIPPKIVKLENGQFYIARAVLKNAPKKGASTTNTTTTPVVGQKRPSLPLVTTASITKDYTGLKDVKRQQRMMKNRESASLSRQRKKEHLQSLELKVSEISAVNSQLQEENQKLKERVQLLESENNKLKDEIQVGSPSPSFISKEKAAKSTTVLLAVLLFIIFNPFMFSSKATNKPSTLIDKPINNIPIHFKSRALLQFDNSNSIDAHFHAPFKRKTLRNVNILDHNKQRGQPHIRFHRRPPARKLSEGLLSHDDFLSEADEKLFQNHLDSFDCEENFNKTDVNRINRILEGFAKGYKKENNQRKMKHKSIKNGESRFDNCTEPHKHPKPLISPYLFRSKQKKFKKKTSLSPKPRVKKREEKSSELPIKFVNSTSQDLLNEIQRKVPRKDDTFYIVSMKDVVILPATNNSQLHRPKFSFIVPSFLKNSNDTSLQEFLQIDCNVLDTKVVRMNRKAFSEPFLTRVQ